MFITFAIFLMVWFCYYIFLAAYFHSMLLTYSHRILCLQKKQKMMLCTYSLIMFVVVLLGSVHFFVYNAIYDIVVQYSDVNQVRDILQMPWLYALIQILKVFELIIPLTCGLFLLYVVHITSQIDEDDEISKSESKFIRSSVFMSQSQ